jgi:nitrate reductase NapE
MARFTIARLGEGKEMTMETATVRGPETAPDKPTRRAELLAFLTLAVLIWPIVAVGIVGGYGFLVWMSQLILGPPGPPGSPH